jgi:hypothetical protein
MGVLVVTNGIKTYLKTPKPVQAMQFVRGNGFTICEWVQNTTAYLVPRGYEHRLRGHSPSPEHDRSTGNTLDSAPAFLVVGGTRVDLNCFVFTPDGEYFETAREEQFLEEYNLQEEGQ